MGLIRNLFSVDGLIQLLYFLPIFLITITVHECAHGYAAYKMGDPTAKMMGRLTLNPLKHMDPFGFIMLMIIGFGWAKPVMINPRNFRNPKRGMAISSLAGPASNILMAMLGAVILGLLNYVGKANGIVYLDLKSLSFYAGASGNSSVFMMALTFFYQFMTMNTYFAVFNLIPIPPLDGSRIATYFLPPKLGYYYNYVERYGFLVLILLINFTGLRYFLQFVVGLIISGITFVLNFVPFLML